VRETHTAAVFLAGERAFKIKKPVHFDFVDFGSVAARRAACEAEVELNRRLSPDVYLGVGDLAVNGRVIEHAVVMRRLPVESSLAARVSRGDPKLRDLVEDVADSLARFHARCPVVGEELPLDQWTPPIDLWRTEVGHMHDLVHEEAPLVCLDRAARLSGSYASGRASLFTYRRDTGLVRDGHGDLLAADVYLLPDGPRLLDCLEFDTRLRICDVLHDAAFLAMDLDHLGRPDLATAFLSRYGQASGVGFPQSLAHFFMAHRALVRAKVAAIRARQPSARGGTEAAALLRLSLKHIRKAQVRLVLLGGLPGTGKTTIASALAAQIPAAHLSSDRVRDELFGPGHYAPADTEQVYDVLLTRAASALRAGEHVLLDATWASEQHRTAARELSRRVDAVPVELLFEVDDRTAADRIRHRPVVAGGSEAGTAVRGQLRQRFDPWPQATSVCTRAGLPETVAASARVIEQVATAALD
jgi:aminoglycoside phosphotransferase family enzyme/predicted kinase